MNNGLMTMYFTNPVFEGFNLKGVGIQRSKTSSHSIVILTTGDMHLLPNTTTVYYGYINSIDLNNIIFNTLAGSKSQTYITIPYGITVGTATNTFTPYLKSIATFPRNALQVNTLTLDTTPPICTSFELNMGSGVLILTFNKPVQAGTLVLPYITLLSVSAGTELNFTANSISTVLLNYTQLHINISLYDMDRIKLEVYGVLDVIRPISGIIIGPRAVQDFYGEFLLLFHFLVSFFIFVSIFFYLSIFLFRCML